MIVVVSIIGLLLALVGPRFIRRPGEGRGEQAAAAQIENLGTALDTFRLDVGRYPSTQEGLGALNQRPVGRRSLGRPVLEEGHPRRIRGAGRSSTGARARRGAYDLYSLGADGAPGGDGPNRDVASWDDDTG